MFQDLQFVSATAAGTQLPAPGVTQRDLVKCIDDQRQQNASTILVSQQDHTLGNPVRQRLLANPHVRFAGYKKPHPLEERIELKVHTDGVQKPEEAVRLACEQLHTHLGQIQSSFIQQLKNYLGEDIRMV